MGRIRFFKIVAAADIPAHLDEQCKGCVRQVANVNNGWIYPPAFAGNCPERVGAPIEQP